MKMNPKVPLKAKRVETDEKTIRLIVGGRLSFANIIDPTEFQGKTFFSTNILLPKDHLPKEVKAVLQKAIDDAIALGVQKVWGGKKPARLDLPLRDGDERRAENPDVYDAYEGCWYLVAKKKSPTVGPVVMAGGKRVFDADAVASGDWAACDINFYPYNRAGNRGVGVGLNGVTLIAHDERFGGGPSEDSVQSGATDLYGEEMAVPTEAGDSLDDLFGEEEPF